MRRLVIVSNRVPPPRERNQLAGGLAIALRDAIVDRETLWFGWSGKTVRGAAPEKAELTQVGRVQFALLDLAEEDHRGFYNGYSNGMLWPLLHGRMDLAEFRREDLAAYQAVNEAFAAALAPLLRPDDTIWIHDYHLFPLGDALRRRGVQSLIGFFLHIPFPPPTDFAALPQGSALLQTLGAYNVIGVQTPDDATNLNAALAGAGVPARASAHPIGIDPIEFARCARKSARGPEAHRLVDSLGERSLILGVDRLDYSKGIPQRFRGYAQLLKRFPEHRGHVTFLQVAPVSRGEVAQYRALRRELDELAGHIAGEYAEFDWAPIRWITRSVARTTLAGFHRRACVGLVTPLRDGMNLVAKEYVAAQEAADPGVLVLSCFAGAASGLDGAIIVNPYDPDEIAEALHQALTMSQAERKSRWDRMNQSVHDVTAESWARNFLSDLEGSRLRTAPARQPRRRALRSKAAGAA